MVKANPLQPSINAGEFSPRMAARVDFSKYPSAAACCKNMLPQPQGGNSRRAGTRFVSEVKDSTAKTRLMRFEFSTTQAYVIEAGNAYFRFYKNQAQITVADTVASIANGTFASDVSSWTDRSGASSSISHNATLKAMNLTSNGTTDAHAEQQVTNTSAVDHVIKFQILGVQGDTVKLRIGTSSTGAELVNDVEFTTGYHAYTFTATAADFYVQYINSRTKAVQIDNVSLIDDAAMELQTPYTTTDLFEIKTAQNANTMFLTHPSYPLYKLERSGHTSWSLTQVNHLDGPYHDENSTTTTFTAAATTGLGITITASATTGINGGDGFKSTDVGRLLRIQHTTNEPGYGIITVFTDTTHVKVDIIRDFNATSASTKWRLGSWSDTTGHPGAVSFFEQRFCAARTNTEPQAFWLSQSADLENQRPDSFDTIVTVEDDDALDFTLAADQANVIQWLSPGTQLVLGTSGGLWVAQSDGPILTPTDIQVRRQVTNGCADVEPARVDDVVVYLQRGKRKIREFTFNFESDGYRAPDLTILSDHITKSTLIEMAYQEEPDSVLWCVRSDGILATMTYKRDQDVVGWSRQELGGVFNTVAPVAESVTSIPGTNGSGQTFDSTERDEVWIIAKRTVNSAPKRFIEFVEKDFDGPVRQDHTSDANWDSAMIDEQQDAFCIDCGLTLDNPVTITDATATNPVVITAVSHGFSDNDIVRIRAIKGMVELNGTAFKVENAAADTFDLTAISDTEEGTFAVVASGSEAWSDAVAECKSHGLKFANANTGDVQQVRVRTSTSNTPSGNAVAGLYADSSGSPGAQVGGDSDTVAINAASTVFTFTWSASIPRLSAGTDYWLVITNSDASVNSTLETVADQGSAYASGKDDTITSISDGSNNYAGDLRAEIVVSNSIDGSGFTAYAADGEVRKEVTSISGLSHLEGETVKILANGAVHPDKTVVLGAITLDYKASRVHVGLGYSHQFESLKLNSGAAAGTAVAKTKRVHKLGMVLKDSATTMIGPKDTELETVEFREVSDPMDTAVPLFTGEKIVEFDGDYDTDARLVIKNDAPAPFTILALASEMKTNESL